MPAYVLELDDTKPRVVKESWRWVIVTLIVALISVAVGVIIGYFSKSDPGSSPAAIRAEELIREADPEIFQKLLDRISAKNIEENLRLMTQDPHVAGTPLDETLAVYLHDQWLDYGLQAELVPYNILLSYPRNSHHNSAIIVEQNGTEVYRTATLEEPLTEDGKHPDIIQPYFAYGASGHAEGELVYANYGRDEDFRLLEDRGVNVSGKVVLVRNGLSSPRNKIANAYNAGAIALLGYSDPGNYNEANVTGVFPDTWWLPGTGVLKGGAANNVGDPSSEPGRPSTWYGYRVTNESLHQILPSIPAHPIGYDAAWQLLSNIEGEAAPQTWQGELNITYRLASQMKLNRTVKVDVENANVMKTSYNVIAKIRGWIEPDRYVMIGNHRDAWEFGAVDPTSGTAGMLEISRVMGELVREGWRPRRTIMFCSWGAEEFGLIGSIEWVEEFVRILNFDAVAYINVDIAVQGNYSFRGRAVPTLRYLYFNAAKLVPDPFREGVTVFDNWNERMYDETEDRPIMALPRSGTDYVAFLYFAGIPVMDTRYTYDTGYSIFFYPLYHTAYETFSLMKMMDPEFECNRVSAVITAEVARALADSYILPFNVTEYARTVQHYVDELIKMEANFTEHKVSVDPVQSASTNFSSAVKIFTNKLKDVDKNDPIAVRILNDKFTAVERAFIEPQGLPLQPNTFIRHILLGLSVNSGTTFPGIVDLMTGIQHSDETQWEDIKRHISVITFAIQSAANILDTELSRGENTDL